MTDSWTLPAPLATAEVRMDDGALILGEYGNPQGPRIVLRATALTVTVERGFRREFFSSWVESVISGDTTLVDDNRTVFQAIDRHFGEINP